MCLANCRADCQDPRLQTACANLMRMPRCPNSDKQVMAVELHALGKGI